MSTNDQQERKRRCRALMREKDLQKLTAVMHSEECDRAMEVCRLLQSERNVARFTALCEELNELLAGMRGRLPN